jgi:hypothetical protein
VKLIKVVIEERDTHIGFWNENVSGSWQSLCVCVCVCVCIYIYIYIYKRYLWLTEWLLEWNPVVSWGAFVYTLKIHWVNHCTVTHSCKHYESYFEVVTVLSVCVWSMTGFWFGCWLTLKLQYLQLLIRGQANSKLCDINKSTFQRLM